MEQRRYIRVPLKLDAQILTKGSDAIACTAMDFCAGGMLVDIGSSMSYFKMHMTLGDEVSVCIQVPSKNSFHSFQLKSRVARIVNCSIGVSFINADKAALLALDNYSHGLERIESLVEKNNGRATFSTNDEGVQRITTLCKRCVSDNITALMQGFFSEVDSALMNSGDKSTNNMVQSSFFAASRELKTKRREIVTGFNKSVIDHFDKYTGGNIGGQGGDSPISSTHGSSLSGLELVGKEDFEGWLVGKVIITRANQTYEKTLLELKLRYSALLNVDLNDQQIPVSPGAFFDAFAGCFSSLAIETISEKVIFDVFESNFINRLALVFDEINDILINSGILPNLDVDNLPRSASGRTSSSCAQKIDVVSDSATEGGVPGYGSEQPHPNDSNLSSRPMGEPLKTQQVASDSGAGRPDFAESPSFAGTDAKNDAVFDSSFLGRIANGNNGHQKQFDQQQSIAKNAYKTIQSLMEIGSKPEKGFEPGSLFHQLKPTLNSDSEGDLKTVSDAEVMQVLDRAQQSLLDNAEGGLVKAAALFDTDTGPKLSTLDQSKLENVDRLFESMLENVSNHEVAIRIEKLKLPLSKLVFSDESFYENQIHPARLLINRIAELDVTGVASNTKALAGIDGVISSVIDNYNSDESVFDTALEDVNKLVDVKKKAYRKNINRVTESCNGQEKIVCAKKACLSAIDRYATEDKMPAIVKVLLDLGWKEVMMLSLLRPEKKEWGDCLRVLDKSVACYLGNEQDSQGEIYDHVCDDIKKYNAGELSDASEFIAYREMLNSAGVQFSSVEIDNVARCFVTKNEEVRLHLESKNAEYIWNNNADLRQPLVRAQNLSIGDLVDFTSVDGLVKRLRLAWLNDSHTYYAFVNEQGIKNLELSLVEIVRRLREDTFKIIQEDGLPLVERGLEFMVEETFDELQHHATHDSLTGLANRKEFDLQIEDIIFEAREFKNQYVVCDLNLDQFKVINNTCSIEAGDQLLKDVSDILQQWMPSSGTVARMGNDEFGLIIRNSNEADAHQIIDNQLHAIEAYRFTWEDKAYSITASVGMVVVNEKTISSGNVMRAVSEALTSAKDAGRNRIEVFSVNDNQIQERQDIMGWVARLNQAMDEDRLHLRGQKISLVSDPEVASHYEVLLSVEGDDGEMLPPAEFIKAAEKYNRMQAVDRWVIKHVFEWLDDNKENMDDFSGLAINLSGNSMNDGSLLEYIFEMFVDYKVPTGKVMFEITETSAITSLDDASDFIREMRSIGCRFALDDFGSGLSSYGYLKHLPVDYVKIDGVFIKDIVSNESDFAMVKSITEMVKFLGMKTVAEYVETDEILEVLKDIGVDYAQGYGIEKPVPLNQVLVTGVNLPGSAAL